MQKKKSKPQGLNRPLPRKMRKKSSQNPAQSPTVEGQKKTPDSTPSSTQQSPSPAPTLGPKQSSPPAKELESKWKTQYEELNKKYQFLMAEYANYKKQNFKQLENLRKYEGQHLIRELLDKVVDNFDLALKQKLTTQNSADFKKGIQMIYDQLKNFLKSTGVKESVKIGDPFNPAFHNALDSMPSEDMPPDHVLHIIKKAYLFHDKLIRPAEVIVSQKSVQKEEPKK